MRKFSNSLAAIAFFVTSFSGLAAMPGLDGMPGLDDSTIIPVDSGMPIVATLSALDQQVATDLGTLGGQSISGYLGILNSILSYVGVESVSSDVQLAYSNAVVKFDKYARRAIKPRGAAKDNSKIAATKKQIFEIDKFLKNLQSSPLIHSSVVSYISSSISFWDGQTKKCGLTPYQVALQRNKNIRSRR